MKNEENTEREGLTDDPLHFGHQATRWRRRGLLREVTGVEDVVHRRAVLAVVEQLVMLGVLINRRATLARDAPR